MADVFPLLPSRYTISQVFGTIITSLGGVNEQRKRVRQFPVYDVRTLFREDECDKDDMQILWNFYRSQEGAYKQFWFYDDFVSDLEHEDLYLGVGDGSTTQFDIPGKQTSLQTVYLNGIEQTITTDYTITINGGDGNSDRVDFVSAPGVGDVGSIDFTGMLRCKVRFEDDNLDRSTLLGVAFNIGLSMRGIGPVV